MTTPQNATYTYRGGRWGHGNAGIAGMNLQNAPNINNQLQQSYVLGMPVGRMPLRPIANSLVGEQPGQPVEYAAGQPGVQTWDTRQTTQQPMYGGWGPAAGWNDSGNSKLPGDPQGDPKPVDHTRMPFQEDDKLGGWQMANEKLVTRDRHAFFKVGTENSGRGSGNTDPPMDGPPRPALAVINRTINWQQGTVYANNQFAPVNVVNGNVDDLSREYTREPNLGMYVGEQGSGWSSVNGGVPGLWQPYGSYAGITAGPVKGIQSPVEQGQPGDGPRKVWSGPPHGLHSPTLPDYSPTLGYYMALPAQRAPRMDRPDNSTTAGQSYSQTVQPQGQTGTTAIHNVNMQPTSNVWNKIHYTPGGGWRGMTGTIGAQ